MGVGFKVGGSATFKSYVTIQANPNVDVKLINGSIEYTAHSDSNGVAELIVKKKGTYDVWTGSGATYEAEGNTSTIDVPKSNKTYRGQRVKLNAPSSFAIGMYSSNVLAPFWDRPNGNWTGCDVRWGTSFPTSRSQGTSLGTTAGESIVITNTSTVNGIKHSGLTKDTTYYYSIFSYITINKVNYWATTYRSASGTARYYIGNDVTITSTGAWVVPSGWRTAKAFVVGGGGGGSAGNGGGGGGGFTKTSGNFNVVPGSSYWATIGAGGSANGGNGGTSSLGSIANASASGGAGGKDGTSSCGGNGGSGGGASAIYRDDHTYDCKGTAGGSNGSGASDTSYYRPSIWVTFKGGTGQGSTTRAFGESNGTLFAGGGGGGGRGSTNAGMSGGAGGSGGGGAGAGLNGTGSNASANTGGGGGGGYYNTGAESKHNGGAGAAGIIIVRCVA